MLLCFFAIILAFVAFVLRDVIFKGRSIGKRIFGLYVLDKNTNEPASIKQRIIRNLFFFIYPVDGIILLAIWIYLIMKLGLIKLKLYI